MLPLTAPPAVYAGVREIQVGGNWHEDLSPARYEVTERYDPARWQGRVATLHGTLVYRLPQRPADGIFLTETTVEQREEFDPDGSIRLLSLDRVIGADHWGGTTASVFRRAVGIAFAGPQTIVPASLKLHREVLSPAATVHRVEWDRGGLLNGTFMERDLRRTIGADGSFEETGVAELGQSAHRIRQLADGSATALDSVPGFSFRDVTVAAPEGTGNDAHVTVTIKSQGRTIGPTPIDTNDYVVPLWYAATWPAPLATAALTVEAPRAPDERCALGTAPLVPVVIERKQVDVTGRIVEEREERDLDRARRVLCHITQTTTRRFDITNGSITGAIIDTAVVHLTAP